MRYTLSILLVLCAWFQELSAQATNWTTPVPIDSTRDYVNPFLAVAPNGQIATLSYGLLYTSDDNGRSFQFRYQFTPPVSYHHQFTPNGLAYDSSSVLWVSWAWDECSDPECTFSIQRKLYISRSTDGGHTFQDVLQYNRGFLVGRNGPHPPWFSIQQDNTVHFLRDSAWFNGSYTEFFLIYTKLPHGDWTNPQDVMLPIVADSLEIEQFFFLLPADNQPMVLVRAYVRTNVHAYYYSTKLQTNGSFSPYFLLESMHSGEVARVNILGSLSDTVFLKYQAANYNVLISTDCGMTFGGPSPISEEAFHINLVDSNYFYAIDRSIPRQAVMYFRFGTLFSLPIDSAFLGTYVSAFPSMDERGGKYVIVTEARNKSYFIGKDIITSIRSESSANLAEVVQLRVSPNPFNNSTTVLFSLPRRGRIDITVYDINGRRVKEVSNYDASPGENRIALAAANLASGMYVVVLRYNNATYTTKAVLIK